MMAHSVPHQPLDNRKRVKVYELRDNDWFDRGTGFCTAQFVFPEETHQKEPRVLVESEDEPNRYLLDTKIARDDSFQKQQDTLIVWTERGVDMALSFQEAEGCGAIWKFIDGIQQAFPGSLNGPDDGLSDDLAMDPTPVIQLPHPELANIAQIEGEMRMMNNSSQGREALAKAIMADDYLAKLAPLVEIAEDLESLDDLHRLCTIMKTILLLNDSIIIERAMTDDCVMGVLGALEYDPEFPSHKANHRQWLNSQGRYREVVKIQDDKICFRIHHTYRLQYLKDVVLARILDDPTFSVLNSIIFFNQVEIVQHLHSNGNFLSDLFGIFADLGELPTRKKEAVLLLQQCSAIGKNLQPPGRLALYTNFLNHGLLQVINFGLRSPDVTVRTGATDIIVAMIDHDPQMLRHTIYRQIQEKQPPLTDTLVDLLLVEVDLGIKSQISDILRILLDPNPPFGHPDARVEFTAGQPRARPQFAVDPQQDLFLNHFYEHSAARLFKPLLDLEKRTEMKFDVLSDGIFSYLNDILCFFIRQHHHRSKYFVIQHNVAQRFAQLLSCKEKHLQLVAIRFFRQLVILQDEFYIKHLTEKQIFGPVLDVLLRTMPRDNLLCSACLDLFSVINKDALKELIRHLVENYREKITALAYMDPFREILNRYEQMQGFAANVDPYVLESEDEGVRRLPHPGARAMMEHLVMDTAQEEYLNAADDDEEVLLRQASPTHTNGSASSKPLVDYSSDDEVEENGDTVMGPAPPSPPEGDDSSKENEDPTAGGGSSSSSSSNSSSNSNSNSNSSRPNGGRRSRNKSHGSGSAIAAAATASAAAAAAAAAVAATHSPPERLAEKRRREEEEEDEMSKMMQQHKRRNSTSTGLNSAGTTSPSPTPTATVPSSPVMASAIRRRKGFVGGGSRDPSPTGPGSKKIAISMPPSLKVAAGGKGGEEERR